VLDVEQQADHPPLQRDQPHVDADRTHGAREVWSSFARWLARDDRFRQERSRDVDDHDDRFGFRRWRAPRYRNGDGAITRGPREAAARSDTTRLPTSPVPSHPVAAGDTDIPLLTGGEGRKPLVSDFVRQAGLSPQHRIVG
jgi:hypothetical protein